MPSNNRDTLRNQMRDRRRQLPAADVKSASLLVCKRIKNLDCFKKANTIAIYQPIHGEIDITPLTKERPGALFLSPTIHLTPTKHLAFFAVPANPSEWVLNQFGIPEPSTHGRSVPIESIDLVIAPLVACDVSCNRLGHGAGFYDRSLAVRNLALPPPLYIGVAYEWQVVESLERQPWDVPLDAVITNDFTFINPDGPLASQHRE